MDSPRGKLYTQAPYLSHISYGLGWMIAQLRGRKIVFHTGGIDGFAALVSFMPKRKLGFVL